MKILFFFFLTLTLYSKQPDPIAKIRKWCKEERREAQGGFFISGSLASVSPQGRPRNRTIKVCCFEKKGAPLFFTRRESAQASDFQCNPYASLSIYLPKTQRQLIVEGRIEEVSSMEGEPYWKKLSFWKKVLFLAPNEVEAIRTEKGLKKKKSLLFNKDARFIPMPTAFLGYRLIPTQMIFYEMPLKNIGKKEIVALEKQEWVVVPSDF